LVEPSPRRREWQRQRLLPFAAKVKWRSQLDDPPARPVTGVIFSNELLDAFPVHRLGWDAARQRWFEWAVSLAGEAFAWARLPLDSNLEKAALQNLSPTLAGRDLAALTAVLPDGFTFEYAPGALAWWRTAAAALERGWLVAFDYGLAADELIRPERTQGTLRAYGGHRVSQDLLAEPGRRDLTAHVNFAALQAAGEAAGLRTEGLVSQESFLMRVAAAAVAAGGCFGEWSEQRSRQLRTLVHPNQMGRSFRVLTQAVPCDV
jgi:SAM-dependent MidA family methyltransferase